MTYQLPSVNVEVLSNQSLPIMKAINFALDNTEFRLHKLNSDEERALRKWVSTFADAAVQMRSY